MDASLPLFSRNDLVQLLGQLPEALDSCPHRLEVTVRFTEQKEKPRAPVTSWKPVAGASFLPPKPALQPGVSGGWSSPQEVTSEQLGAAGREQMDQGSWGQGQGQILQKGEPCGFLLESVSRWFENWLVGSLGGLGVSYRQS